MSENLPAKEASKAENGQPVAHAMHSTYVWASVVLGVVLVLAVSAYAIVARLAEVPGKTAEGLGKAIAGAVSTNVTSDFQSYVEKKEKHQNLVLCTVSRVEMQTKRFGFEVKGKELSSAILEIRSPVTYHYYVDMRGKWELINRDGELLVVAPRLQALEPAINLEQMKTSIDSGKLIFGEDSKMDQFKKEFLGILREKSGSQEYLEQVRAESRASLAEFVNAWIVKAMPGGQTVRSVSIRFEDEKDFPFLGYHVKRM